MTDDYFNSNLNDWNFNTTFSYNSFKQAVGIPQIKKPPKPDNGPVILICGDCRAITVDEYFDKYRMRARAGQHINNICARCREVPEL